MAGTVLIVEDSEGAAAPLEVALEGIDGLRVHLLTSALDALPFLTDPGDRIAALVTDLHLPQMDGFELISLIRNSKRYSSLPIVVVSGDSCPDTMERLHRLGTDAYFPKPYSPSAIRHKLESLLDAD